MTGEIGALGDLATVGLAARSLDRAPPGEAAHGPCANCGADLHGRFCGNCGQAAHVHRSLIHVVEEFLHGITHFDGKAWQTLPMLLFKPGRLTRDYILGKRARYVAPVPLFLLVVFLMFLAFSLTGANVMNLSGGETPQEAQAALPKARASLAGIDTGLEKARAAQEDSRAIAALEAARVSETAAVARLEARAAGREVAEGSGDSSGLVGAIQAADKQGKLNVNLGSRGLEARVRHAIHNPELALYKVQGVAYKFSFLLVPLSLPWLWLLFAFKRGVRMYDHAVFALYSISFMSLLFIVVSVAAALGVTGGTFYFLLLGVAPLVHMFVQLKGAYAISSGGAAWRTAALAIASVVTLSLYTTLILILGLID